MRGHLCSNKFQNLVWRAVFCLESRAVFIFQNMRNYMVSFKSCVPDAMPAGGFGELEILLFDFFKPFFPGVVSAAASWELKT